MEFGTKSANGALPTTAPRRHVIAVDFDVFGTEEIARLAVLRVNNPNCFTGGQPVSGSCCDLRLGTTDARLVCKTCGQNSRTCGGHYGVIPLAYPVYHVCFLPVVLRVLRLVCYFCSELLLSAPQREALQNQARRDRKRCLVLAGNFIKNLTRLVCPQCKNQNPVYTRQGLAIHADFSNVNFSSEETRRRCLQPFTAADAKVVLMHVSPETYTLLGLRPHRTRLESLIPQVLLVPPPLIRPSTTVAEGSRVRGLDDLTMKLNEIVKVNQTTRHTLNQERLSVVETGFSLVAQQAIVDLAFHVNTFFHNDTKGGQKTSYQRSGLPFKSLTLRLKGKEGRIRGTMVGKRVNFSARSVVSPDPMIDADEIGMPLCLAQILTLPEVVTPLNCEQLRQRVRIGPYSIDGALSIIKQKAGHTIMLAFADCLLQAEHLEFDDVVERPLTTGDVVLFNRQPSLHKGSIIGQRVRLMPNLTFGVNLISSPSTNMDCDGDEMNVHVLQSAKAMLEARLLMFLPFQIVSPHGNKPCMGLVQDGILGLYQLSDPKCVVPVGLFYKLCAVVRHNRAVVDELCQRPWPGTVSGIQVLSCLFSRTFFYERRNMTGQKVRIEGGRLRCGRMDKSVLGTSSNSVVHQIWLESGATACCNFLSDAQRVACVYLQHAGYSVRLSDCLVLPETRNKVQDIVQRAEVITHLVTAELGEMLNKHEHSVTQVANSVLTEVGKLVHGKLNETNALFGTVTCGSKGNLINIAQIMGCVGQQVLEGQRIHGVVDGGGTHGSPQHLLPLPAATSVLSKHGFVDRSYVQGLSESQFFFHAMAGREGLIDTSVKTANTGYLQRRLMRALETLQVHGNGTVRNSRGQVVEFLYGGDGCDATYLVKTTLLCLCPPHMSLVLECRHPEVTAGKEADSLASCLRQVLYYRLRCWTLEVPTELTTPFHLDHVMHLVRAETALGVSSDLPGPEETVNVTHADALELLITRVLAAPMPAGAPSLSSDSRASTARNAHDAKLPRRDRCVGLELQLRWGLRAGGPHGPMLRKHPHIWSLIATQLVWQLRRATAAAGEMVGAIAAQAIGSDATQMTLNVFHHAGVAGKDVTLGVHRLKELTDCTRRVRNATMWLPLRDVEASSTARGSIKAVVPNVTDLMETVAPTGGEVPSRNEEEDEERGEEEDEGEERPGPSTTFLGCDDPGIIEGGITLQNLLHREPILLEALDKPESLSILGTDAQQAYVRHQRWRQLVLGRGGSSGGQLECSWLLCFVLNPQAMVQAGLWPRDVSEAIRLNVSKTFLGSISTIYAEPEMRTWFVLVQLRPPFPALSHVAAPRVLLLQCRRLRVKGTPQVERCRVVEQTLWQGPITPEPGPVEEPIPFPRPTRVLVCSGSNFEAALQCPSVVDIQCRCNDVVDTFQVLGLEAAAAVLFDELLTCIQFDGSYINARHVLLLVNLMTYLGHLLPISRHGLNRLNDNGVLARCSFEETCDQIFDAAVYSERDRLLGVTECVCMGQLSRIGTGLALAPKATNVPAARSSTATSSETSSVMAAFEATLRYFSQNMQRLSSTTAAVPETSSLFGPFTESVFVDNRPPEAPVAPVLVKTVLDGETDKTAKGSNDDGKSEDCVLGKPSMFSTVPSTLSSHPVPAYEASHCEPLFAATELVDVFEPPSP
jgi:DNA-directed RNA polymerase beta' subunit